MPTMGKERSVLRWLFPGAVGADLAAARADGRFRDLGETDFFMVQSHCGHLVFGIGFLIQRTFSGILLIFESRALIEASL